MPILTNRRGFTRFFDVSTAIRALSLALCLAACASWDLAAEDAQYPRVIVSAAVKPSEGGALSVGKIDGRRTLCDAKGRPIQLRGMSTHGLQWYPGILNANAFSALSRDWGSNVVRLALYVTESGYGTRPALFDSVVKGIRLAKEADMYVIVDWHVLNPGDPSASAYAGAMDFFRRVASLFPNDGSILYELCNEPNGNAPGVTNDRDGWLAVKAYAEPIIEMLRKGGNRNVVIVGTPNWSQRPDLAIADPLADANAMYAFHFYAGTHFADEYVWNNATKALEAGLPLFATEWGTSAASGDGGPYLAASDAWVDFMNRNNVSWCNWSLTTRDETSGSFRPSRRGVGAPSLDPGSDGAWAPEELSASGEYARARIKGVAYEPIERE